MEVQISRKREGGLTVLHWGRDCAEEWTWAIAGSVLNSGGTKAVTPRMVLSWMSHRSWLTRSSGWDFGKPLIALMINKSWTLFNNPHLNYFAIFVVQLCWCKCFYILNLKSCLVIKPTMSGKNWQLPASRCPGYHPNCNYIHCARYPSQHQSTETCLFVKQHGLVLVSS